MIAALIGESRMFDNLSKRSRYTAHSKLRVSTLSVNLLLLLDKHWCKLVQVFLTM